MSICVAIVLLVLVLLTGWHKRVQARFIQWRIAHERMHKVALVAERTWNRELEQDGVLMEVLRLREELHVAEAKLMAVDPTTAKERGIDRMRVVGGGR